MLHALPAIPCAGAGAAGYEAAQKVVYMSMPEWGEDKGTRGTCEWYCGECESTGSTAWVTQYGCTEYAVEECPVCGGEVEYGD